jgi:hypothetical protein
LLDVFPRRAPRVERERSYPPAPNTPSTRSIPSRALGGSAAWRAAVESHAPPTRGGGALLEPPRATPHELQAQRSRSLVNDRDRPPPPARRGASISHDSADAGSGRRRATPPVARSGRSSAADLRAATTLAQREARLEAAVARAEHALAGPTRSRADRTVRAPGRAVRRSDRPRSAARPRGRAELLESWSRAGEVFSRRRKNGPSGPVGRSRARAAGAAWGGNAQAQANPLGAADSREPHI